MISTDKPLDLANTPAERATQNVVVVVRGDKLDAELVKMACSYARPKEARILALFGIEVPRSKKLNEHLPDEEARANKALQVAASVAERCDYEIEPEMVQSRSFAHSVVEEVNQQNSSLLIMGVPYAEKGNGACNLDDSIDYILEHATCRVWLIRGSKDTI
jgi:K+-sensing histidine kinase KdpD